MPEDDPGRAHGYRQSKALEQQPGGGERLLQTLIHSHDLIPVSGRARLRYTSHMTDFRLKQQGDVFHVIGTITERAEFSAVVRATKHPVVVNFQGTIQISSAGAMKLRELVLAMPDQALEFHECPPFLVELFNMIPDLTHMAGHRVRVISVYMPYTCENCRVSADVLKKTADIKRAGEQIKLGTSRCHQCANLLIPVVDEHDFLHFMFG